VKKNLSSVVAIGIYIYIKVARREVLTQPDNFYVVWYNSTTQDLFLVFSLKNAMSLQFCVLLSIF
jgi:hypothetical protein